MTTETPTTMRLTAEEFLEWAQRPENAGRSCELERGEIVDAPPPQRPHGVYCWLAIKVLTEYIVRRGSGYMCTNDTGIIVQRKPDTLRGADAVLFLETPKPEQIASGYIEDVPDLGGGSAFTGGSAGEDQPPDRAVPSPRHPPGVADRPGRAQRHRVSAQRVP
jgi:Uma2 family endonuclease